MSFVDERRIQPDNDCALIVTSPSCRVSFTFVFCFGGSAADERIDPGKVFPFIIKWW